MIQDPKRPEEVEAKIIHEIRIISKMGDYLATLSYATRLSRYAFFLAMWSFIFFAGLIILLIFSAGYFLNLNIDRLSGQLANRLPNACAMVTHCPATSGEHR